MKAPCSGARGRGGWWLVVAGWALVGSAAVALDSGHLDSDEPLRRVRNAAFGVGERLVFAMQFGPVVAGEARLEVPEVVQVGGRPCFRVTSHARSNRLFSTFYKVNDQVESLVDVAGIFPWRFAKRLREGRYVADRTVVYEQHRGRAITRDDTLAVPPFVQDALSGLYYVRTLDLAVGREVIVDHHNNGKVYPLVVKVRGREVVNVPAGYFYCLVVEPMTRDPGLFKAKGTLKVWLTDDARKMPVQMESQIPVGTITARLVSFVQGDTVQGAAWRP